MKIIECVPNFSEGCDKNKLEAIAGAIGSFSSVRLVDFSGDSDHNRSVYTLLGNPEDVLEAALAAAGKALELIDMRRQKGVHPRLGAVDVVPFIPLADSSLADAVAVAHCFGQNLYAKFGVPVYYYGAAAINPARRELPDARRGGYEGLAEKMKTPEGIPDVGGPGFDERSGATAVGARLPLVAYNINLKTDDLHLAQRIASRIREKNGGLKCVRAIGVELKSRGIVQVSMNLINYIETPLKPVYDSVQKLAAASGIDIAESELIGLAPEAAFAGATPEYLKLKDFHENRLLETHIKSFLAQTC